ncbi:MAG TPA: RpiB/LacA/LacB family sugar-phosphate isomerase [Firmicutes bacterium]|jgi:ribose 5-phosphate isomerase B|nr:RpiB/LacA/LacB family sugar-phosphate isomerase [candidate division WOR-3 bacterium]HFD04532.1 RpiB/LacA/LacB family sugar-phosphate isomerase [Bacillota bacterium]
MKISIGSDHAGFEHKELIKRYLINAGHEVVDRGTDSKESCDYSKFALLVSEDVARGKADRGVLICNTGIGMSIAANKVRGSYAALIRTKEDAFAARHHNNSNIACFGAARNTTDEIIAFMEIWLKEGFDGGRHARRVNLIKDYENKHIIGGGDE